MSDSTRTFLALTVPAAVAAKLERLQSFLEPLAPGGRWDVARPFHVTLAFPGDVSHADLNEVCKVAVETASKFDPFTLRLESPGAFPDPARARVVWAGVGGLGLPAVLALQADLAAALAAIGYPTDPHPFRPHVTIGRFKPRRGDATDLTAPLHRYRGWNTQEFPVTELITFGSRLGPDGPSYTPLGHARLGAPKPPTST